MRKPRDIKRCDLVAGNSYLNSLEPPQLYDAFIAHPPEGFTARYAAADGGTLPVFLTRFDLLTTLDEKAKHAVARLPLVRPLSRAFLRPRAAFCGTTVSEYAVYHPSENPDSFPRTLLSEMKAWDAELAIFKDIPLNSPLLTARENTVADKLLAACRANSFSILEGQALAYVPIDFVTEDEYLARFSAKRRYDFRRKLKSRTHLDLEEVPTGDPRFDDDMFVDDLYAMYESVFEQSEIHFDKLSRSFFASVFRDATSGGVVFFYRTTGKLIGWKLCFVCGGNLVDKYVGFVYPEARDSNLYFIGWFHCLDFAIRHSLRTYVVGWTDAKVKAHLGASFTFTHHAVYLRSPLFRFVLNRFERFFEPDKNFVADLGVTR
ncbi:MAG TPA: GNAT family N-acetyltransferase [Thermoanaerobaculia bacterium]|nr:GNAT family N-acetyltransferase [Thermoanaerobaculia bacterium]